MGMCRFEEVNDDGYEKFKDVLANFIDEVKTEQQNAVHARLEIDSTRRAGQSFYRIWSTHRSKVDGNMLTDLSLNRFAAKS